MGNADGAVRAPMPALDAIHERLARHLRSGLGRFLQRPVEVVVRAPAVLRFDAFMRQLGTPVTMHLLRVRPLRGMALMLCDRTLVAAVVDTLFGGPSTPAAEASPQRELSATEQRIVRRLVEAISAEVARSWLPVHPLALEYARAEGDPRFAQIALPAEMVVTTAIDITLGETTACVLLGIPLGSFDPIRDLLQASAAGEPGASDRRFVDLLMQQIKSATVELVAELAHGQATVGELLALKPGDFIALDIEPTLVAKVDGVPVLACDYGTLGHRYGLRVREFIAQPSQAPSSTKDSR
nr:FliM/FliN family flagellar motor switch protein [Ramlibacter aurantiacus]